MKVIFNSDLQALSLILIMLTAGIRPHHFLDVLLILHFSLLITMKHMQETY